MRSRGYRVLVIALAAVTLQVATAGGYLLYICSMQQGAQATCCCPAPDEAQGEPSLPAETSFEKASCCDVQAVEIETAPRDSVRTGGGGDAVATPVMIASLVEAPLQAAIDEITFAADRQVRGPPLRLLKQSLLR